MKSQQNSSDILVVEDCKHNSLILQMLLEKWGYNPDFSTSGEDALEKIAGRNVPYRAILMDVQMISMDGYETTRQIRLLEKAKYHKHQIVGVTAHALAGDHKKCLDAGMDDYITKPIHFDLLEQKLKSIEL